MKAPKSKIPVALGVIVAALVGGLIAGQIQNRNTKGLAVEFDGVPAVPPPAGGSAPGAAAPPPAIDDAPPVAAVPETDGERREREAIVQWRQSEAKKLDSTQVNEDLEIAGLAERIKKFTPTEWRETARNFADRDGVATERVLSAYVLGNGGLDSEFTEGLIAEVLSKPLPDPGPHEPHSLEETSAMKEKSLRILVIDELIQQVKRDSRKRAGLEKAVRSIADDSVRALALRRMREEGL